MMRSATAHRAQASTEAVAQAAPVACAGVLMAGELDALGKALKQPARPMVAIVAGSKVSTKLTILESLADKVDQLIVGGGIANTFLLAEGKAIGKSLAEHDLVEESKNYGENDSQRRFCAAADRCRRCQSLCRRCRSGGKRHRRRCRRRDDFGHRYEIRRRACRFA